MKVSERLATPRKRHVDLFARELLGERALPELLILLGNQRLDLRFGLVDDLADLRTILLRERAHAAQDRGERSLLAEELHADLIELRETARRLLDCLGRLRLQLFDFFFHVQ